MKTRNISNLVVQRWITLTAIFANIIFSYIYYIVTPSPNVAEVTENYPTYFTPVPFTFSIWGLIYFAFIVYGIIQVLPSQRDHSIYDKLSGPVTWVNLLGALWTVLYTSNMIGLSLLVTGLMLVCAAVLFSWSHRAVVSENYNLWLQVPFCMLAGWLTILLPANIFVYLKILGWSMEISEGVLTGTAILAVTFAGFVVSLRTSSLVYPSVIVWGLFGIHIARQNDMPDIAYTAITCAWLLMAGSVWLAVSKKIKVRKKIKSGMDA